MLRIVAPRDGPKPHLVAGIVQGGGVAPIIRYMKGWTYRKIKAYCARRGWACEVMTWDE